MNDTLPVGVTPRDRIDRVMNILAREVGPRLLQHPRLESVQLTTKGNRIVTVGQLSARRRKLDALECCHVILNAPESLFKDIRQTTDDLRVLRNDVSHPKREFGEADAVSAASGVARLLQHFGRTKAARMAERYRVGPTIRYVTALRNYLIGGIDGAAQTNSPRKSEQDGLDAYLCLLVALCLAERKDCLMVGDLTTGYIVVPYGAELHAELDARCNQTGRAPSKWVRAFRLGSTAP